MVAQPLVTPRKDGPKKSSARKTDRPSARTERTLGHSYSVERPSVLSLTSSRPSVAPGRNVGTAKDKRPLGDKAFQGKCVRDIVAFLREHLYPGSTDESALRKGPTRKEFFLMMEFLHGLALQVHLVSEDFQATEEGVVGLFKQMRYPFILSTTFIKSVNAPGTWPNVLAAVHWLVMIVAAARSVDCTLVYQHKEEEDRPSVLPSATPGRAPPVQDPAELLHLDPNLFHMYVIKTYEQFMKGDDAGQEATDQDLRIHVEDTVAGVEREEAELSAKRRQLIDAVEILESARAIDRDVLAKGEQGEQQCEKYRLLMASQDAHTAELASAVAAMEAGVARQQQEAAQLDDELAALTKQVSEQEWTAEAVAKLRAEQAAHQRATTSLLQEQARLTAEAAARNDRAEAATQALGRAVRELQARAAAHPTSEAAAALRGLRVDAAAPEGASLVGVDLRDVALALRTQGDEATAAREQLEDASRTVAEEVQRLEAEARELEDRAARVEQRVQHQHRLHEQEISLSRSKWDAQSEEMSALEKENCGGNSELQALQARVREAAGAAQALEQELRAAKLAAADAQQEADERLATAVEAAYGEKRAVLAKLEGLRARTAAA